VKRAVIISLALGTLGVLHIGDRVAQPFAGQGVPRDPSIQVDPAALEKHVRKLAVEFVPRDVTHPANLDRTAAYISAELQRAGGMMARQVYTAQRQKYQNVIATFGPITGERIIVAAHYDAWGAHPAADDNATGVAALIELGKHLRKTPLHRRVDLVALTGEEAPFYGTDDMGSVRHARMLKESNIAVRAMISLESIGYFSDQPQSQKYPTTLLRLLYPSRANFIAVVGRLEDRWLVGRIKAGMKKGSAVPVASMNGPVSIEGVDYSDHRSYWAQGYPAAMITDTAFFRNPNYHQASDTPETIDYARLAQVVSGVYEAVVTLAK